MLPQAGAGFLGVLMLDTRFPRPPGDVGHPQTFAWPVRRRVVPGAWPREVVTSAQGLRASPMLPAFVQAMRDLEQEGARALTTSCGFLVLLQEELQRAVSIPVVSSSLLQLPGHLEREERVGVLTISAEWLTQDYLLAAGVPRARLRDVVVQGVDPQGEFATCILGNRSEVDLDQARADAVQAALALQARAPDVRSVVLECTNLPPYAAAMRAATGLRFLALPDSPRLQGCFAV